MHGERLQAVQGIVYLLLTRDGVLRQLTLAAVLGIHSSTGVLASPNAFLHSFLKRLYKIRKSQFFGIFATTAIQRRYSDSVHLRQLTHVAVLVLTGNARHKTNNDEIICRPSLYHL